MMYTIILLTLSGLGLDFGRDGSGEVGLSLGEVDLADACLAEVALA